MDTAQLLNQINRLIKSAQPSDAIFGIYAEACEFLRIYSGTKSQFLESLKTINPLHVNSQYVSKNIVAILSAFRAYVEAGLHAEITPERRAQLDVVSDFLEQAHRLLESKGIHPAAPAVLIGAALEEFLRTWVENEGFGIGNGKPTLDTYAKMLREVEKITKQDYKDITSWAGLRNHAAHGEWDEVDDKNRVSLMLEGVNLFMRKYGA